MRSYIRRGGEGRKKKKKGSPCPTNRCPTRAERRSICHGNGESQWKSQREKSGAQFSGPGSSASVDMTSTAVGPSLVKNPPLILSIPSHSYTTSNQEKRTRTRRKKKSSFFKKRRKRRFCFFFFSVQKRKGRLWLPISSFSSLTSLL